MNLVEQFIKGYEPAFKQIFHENYTKLLMFANSYVHDSEDAWYQQYCRALKLPIVLGDRTQGQVIEYPYADAYWSNSIPQLEIDFRTK